MSILKIWDGGQYVVGNRIRVYDDTTHYPVNTAWQWNGEAWVEIWPGGSPINAFEYYTTWAQSYSYQTINNSSHRDELNYQGESSVHGDESSLWGFDNAQIQADLAGKNIVAIEARLTSRWTYAGGGKAYHVMSHSHMSKPSTVILGPIFGDVTLPRTGSGIIAIPISIGEGLRDGTLGGIGLRFAQPGEYAWGYCTGMYSTSSPVASPGDGDIIACPTDQLTKLTITTG